MVMCFAPDCKHYSEQRTCNFFRFPKDPLERKKWISLLRRKDKEPSIHALVCSCHFVDKNRKNGPTIFEHNKAKRFPEDKLEKVSKKLRKSSLIGDDVQVDTQAREALSTNLSMPTTSSSSPKPGTSNREVVDNLASDLVECEPVPSTSKGPDFNFSATAEAEIYFLQKELEEAKGKLEKLTLSFSYEHIKNSDKKVHLYTGLPCNQIFMTLFTLLESYKLNYYQGWEVVNVPKIDQLLLTLMKLHLNLLNEDLGIRFNISRKTVANIFYTWLYALHEIIYKNFMSKIPSRNKNRLCMPTCFNNFTNCRIILDCTEIYCIQTKNMEKQKATYSSYKHRNTLKVLIGVAPNGVITYVSEMYPGSVSDKKIVQHCGILDQFEAGDLIIADKGFLIRDMLPPGVNLNIPPFLTTPQFTPQQVVQTRTIAKARIHVERAIRRLKCYKILGLFPAHLLSHASIICQVCAALTNLHFPLIKEVENLFSDSDED